MEAVSHCFGVVVRDADLYLHLRIVRDPKTDVYVNWPWEAFDSGCKPHTSWHASGQYHNKSYNHKLGRVANRQKPNTAFTDTENLITTDISLEKVRAFNAPCEVEDFTDVFEIPGAELIPGIGRMLLSVDLSAPRSLPLVPNSACPWFRTVAQKAFQDAHPWIVVTLFDTDAPFEPHQ
jgi:hypothetical protein